MAFHMFIKVFPYYIVEVDFQYKNQLQINIFLLFVDLKGVMDALIMLNEYSALNLKKFELSL